MNAFSDVVRFIVKVSSGSNVWSPMIGTATVPVTPPTSIVIGVVEPSKSEPADAVPLEIE